MTFTAKLKRNGSIWTAWRQRHAAAGAVAGVAFRWVAGDDYVSGELTPAQVAALRSQPEVVLETFGAAAAPPLPVPPVPMDKAQRNVMQETTQDIANLAVQARSKEAQRKADYRRRLREQRVAGTG